MRALLPPAHSERATVLIAVDAAAQQRSRLARSATWEAGTLTQFPAAKFEMARIWLGALGREAARPPAA